MLKQESHTIVRFSLRSMLMLTFGIAVVMALAGPFYRAQPYEFQIRLIASVVALIVGMAIGTFKLYRKRKHFEQQYRPLLFSFPTPLAHHKIWLRWIWLLVVLPAPLIYINFFTLQSGFSSSLLVCMYVLTVNMGIGLTPTTLFLWTEGVASTIHLCEKGLLFPTTFYAWDSPRIKEIRWNNANCHLMVYYIFYDQLSIQVPEEQRETVDTIITRHFKNHPPEPGPLNR